jgi:hypothetical protein
MLQENGDVYMTHGYFNPENNADKKSDDSSIRWVFKLARYDLLSCNAVSDGLNCYIEPSYYPNGFDFDYKSVVAGSINDKGTLVFDVDWDTDALIIGEDYYAHGNIIEKETYELERNADGKFVLEVARRNDENEHANYFIKGESGTYVLHIDFPFAPKTTDLDTAIHNAIMEHNKDRYYKGVFTCESHIVLATEAVEPASAGQIETLTVYALALYEEYDLSEEGIQSVSGGCIPVALTFHVTETGYALSEYWEPGDGADYSDDIRDKFPEDVLDTIWNPQNHVDALKAENHRKALDFSAQKGDFKELVRGLLTAICAKPAASSNPEDYIQANRAQYDELLRYGDSTLKFCFTQFLGAVRRICAGTSWRLYAKTGCTKWANRFFWPIQKD